MATLCKEKMCLRGREGTPDVFLYHETQTRNCSPQTQQKGLQIHTSSSNEWLQAGGMFRCPLDQAGLKLNPFQGGYSENSKCCPSNGALLALSPHSASTQIPAPGLDPGFFLLDPSPSKEKQ